MRQLTILVDMDDTIEYLLKPWVDCLNNRHGTTVKCNDITEWDLRKSFPTLTKEQILAPLVEDEFWETVKPIDGAVEALRWMKESGHKVYIVTASDYRSIRPKMENVLFKYFPFLTWSDVVVASNKQMIKGDILFDDAPHNLEGGKYVKILMDAPHNRLYDADANNMYRMKDWQDAKHIVQTVLYKQVIQTWQDSSSEFVEQYFKISLLPVQKRILEIMFR